ncbi:MAG: PEP-CTERM sorting domain-containing protein [Candidatus Thiodiazotropha sp.]
MSLKRFNTLLKPWLLLALSALPLSAAQAATIHYSSPGVATGISNLIVGTNAYNVDFTNSLTHQQWPANFDVTTQAEADSVLTEIGTLFNAAGVSSVQYQGLNGDYLTSSATLWYGTNATQLLGSSIHGVTGWIGFIGASTAPLNSSFPGGIDLTPVPVPAAVWLFGTGLLGLVGLSKKKRKA